MNFWYFLVPAISVTILLTRLCDWTYFSNRNGFEYRCYHRECLSIFSYCSCQSCNIGTSSRTHKNSAHSLSKTDRFYTCCDLNIVSHIANLRAILDFTLDIMLNIFCGEIIFRNSLLNWQLFSPLILFRNHLNAVSQQQYVYVMPPNAASSFRLISTNHYWPANIAIIGSYYMPVLAEYISKLSLGTNA